MWNDLGERAGRAIAKRIVTRSHPLRPARAMVSFSFDDVPVSAATAGAAILERSGLRGSFYVCGELAGGRSELYPLAGLELVAELARRGHEVGCHTARHARLGDVTRDAFLREVERNAAVLAPVVGAGGLRTFAYPYGRVRLDAKLVLQRRFRACRGIHDGINLGRLDLGRLRAAPLEDASSDRASVDRLVAETARRCGWLVFYAHDVAEAPTRFGVTPGLLAHAVGSARAHGRLVATVDGALDAAGVP